MMKTYTTLQTILHASELLSVLVAFAYFGKLKSSRWRVFPFYLLLVFAFEMAGKYWLSSPALMKYNPVLFNLVSFPMQFLFFFWLFYTEKLLHRIKKAIPWLALFYLLTVVADAYYFYGKIYFFHSFSYSIGNIILTYLLINYFFRLGDSDEVLSFSTKLMFWVCLGVGIYYLCTLPYWAIRNVLVYHHTKIFFKYAYVQLSLSALMYLLFTIGIIKCRTKLLD